MLSKSQGKSRIKRISKSYSAGRQRSKQLAEVLQKKSPLCPWVYRKLLNISLLPIILLILAAVSGFAQSPTTATGNELTEMKIEVRQATVPNNSAKNTAKETPAIAAATLPIEKVPILEEGETLIIEFCKECRGRKIEDLGFRKMVVFFVNPASVYADLKDNFEKAVREIEFESGSKKKKAQIYSRHELKVPYRSIPLIFLVSNGEYSKELRKVILEKQADVIRLGEQSNILVELPQVVQYLLEVKSVLNTPAAFNTRVAQSLLQRAQIFRLDPTNCFNQPLYKQERDQLECLVKNFNVAEFEKDLNGLSLDKYGKLAGSEIVSQLRNKYDGLNVFFDAAVAVIEIVGAAFKKKPLNIQFGSLAPGRNDYLSLRQVPVNLQANTERALLIAPLKWREKEEILTGKSLNTVDILPDKQCLDTGKNVLWFETGNALIKKEIKKVAVRLENKADARQSYAFGELPISPVDDSIPLAIDEKIWRKIKDWRDIRGKASFDYNFEKIEKDFDLKILPPPRWQILQSKNDILRRGADSVVKISPNTEKRACLDKIVVTDTKKQEIELLPFREISFDDNGNLNLKMTASASEKLQPGKLLVSIYENGNETTVGKLNLTLFDKRPQPVFKAHLKDRFALMSGEKLDEISAVSVDGKKTEIDFATRKIKLEEAFKKDSAVFTFHLKAGDSFTQNVAIAASRPALSGELGCRIEENRSFYRIATKHSYKQYELTDCVYPTETDEIKFVLIADESYSFSSVNKPTVVFGFPKNDSLTPADKEKQFEISDTKASVQLLSPQRIDLAFKIEQKTKEYLEDGNPLYLKIIDPVRGESDWYQVGATFLRLPSALILDCRESPDIRESASGTISDAKKDESIACELVGNLAVFESLFVKSADNKQQKYPLSLTSDKITISVSSNAVEFYLKLRNYGPKIKLKLPINIPAAPIPEKNSDSAQPNIKN